MSHLTSWTLIPPESVTPTAANPFPFTAPTVPLDARSAATGLGLLRPFRFDRKADFASGSGPELINAALGQLIGTICQSATSRGELPWRTQFGSQVPLLRFANNDPILRDLVRVRVQEAVERWEPRVLITDISTVPSTDPNAVVARIHWKLRQTQSNASAVLSAGRVDVAL